MGDDADGDRCPFALSAGPGPGSAPVGRPRPLRKTGSNFYVLRAPDRPDHTIPHLSAREGDFVLDVLMLGLVAAFFAAGLVYVFLCDRL